MKRMTLIEIGRAFDNLVVSNEKAKSLNAEERISAKLAALEKQAASKLASNPEELRVKAKMIAVLNSGFFDSDLVESFIGDVLRQ